MVVVGGDEVNGGDYDCVVAGLRYYTKINNITRMYAEKTLYSRTLK